METFRLQKSLSPTKVDKKAGILRCERMETIVHFRKSMMAHHYFIIQKNKREGNYFKGKLWVLYKLKTKTSDKG